jgi:hypothetical protein
MKKIMIAVGALGVMSFTTNQLMNTYQLAEAIDSIQDMKEWMIEDQKQGMIDSVYAEYYLQSLNETEWRLIEFAESNRLTIPTGDYGVNINGNITN